MEEKNATCYPLCLVFHICFSIKNIYLIISAVLIWEGYSNYAGIILGSMQGIVLPPFVNTKPADNINFSKTIGIDRYTLIEQSGNYAH